MQGRCQSARFHEMSRFGCRIWRRIATFNMLAANANSAGGSMRRPISHGHRIASCAHLPDEQPASHKDCTEDPTCDQRRHRATFYIAHSATTGRYSSHGVARVLTSAHGTNEHFSEHFRFRVSRLKEGLFPSCSCATTPRTAATTDRGHVSARLEGATLFEGARAQRNARRHVRVHRAPFPDDALIQVKQPILEVGPDHRPDGACKTR